MTKFIFKGANGTRLGRHNIVNAGDALFLRDDELASVANNPNFQQADSTSNEVREVEIAFDQMGLVVPGTNRQSIVVPCDFFVTSIKAYLDFPLPAGGVTIDVNKNGVSILGSAKVTIDANESSNDTAAVPCVISDPELPEGSTVSIDIDSAPPESGSNVLGGLRLFLIGTSPTARIRITADTASPGKFPR